MASEKYFWEWPKHFFPMKQFFLNDLQSCTTGDICVAVLWTWFIWPLFAKREFLNVLNSLRRFLRRILETQTGWRGSPTCVFSDERCFKIFLSSDWASLVAQTVKCLPAMLEPWVWSLSREDPLEKEMATHSSILAWEIPWTEKPGRLQAMGFQRVRHDLVTKQHIGFGLSCFCWHLFLGIRYFLFDFLSDPWLFKSVLFNFHVFVFVFFTGFFPLWLMSNFMKVCVYKVGYTNP